jgi:hypothetical protein
MAQARAVELCATRADVAQRRALQQHPRQRQVIEIEPRARERLGPAHDAASGRLRRRRLTAALVPTDDTSAGAYEAQHSHPDVVKAVKGDKKKYRDLYVRMALHQTSHITGNDDRDLRAIDKMATLRQDSANAFTDRDPASFAD